MAKVGIVGLGRLGRIHAENLAFRVPGLELVAACSVVPEELKYAEEVLQVEETYKSYEAMIDDGKVEAVVIVSPSGFHTHQVRYALQSGLHVFTEKPLGIELDDIEETVKVINDHPDQVFQLGFMRRYDGSYQYAKEIVDKGEIGEITLIRCYGIDPSSGMESFVKFAREASSGGLFLDMSIHDIDLLRWFTKEEPKKVWALGKNSAYPELDELGELEIGAAMLEMKNGAMALLVAGRNAAHGYHVETEIIGTKGMLRVGTAPEKNLVTVLDSNGVVRPTSQNFPERFREAFLNELIEFSNCIKEKRQPDVTAFDGLQSTKIGLACQKSYEENTLIEIN